MKLKIIESFQLFSLIWGNWYAIMLLKTDKNYYPNNTFKICKSLFSKQIQKNIDGTPFVNVHI